MALLIFVRHGQSLYNFENRFTGSLDIGLTPLGRQEAKNAGAKLKGYVFDIAYTSMLVRAWESLEIILHEIHLKIPIVKNSALNERMYGSLQGLNKTETAQKYGVEQVQVWRRSYDIRPPGGESLADTAKRVIPYYENVIAAQLKMGKNVLIVAHGNSLRALMMHLENISPQDICAVNIPTGVPRMYHFDADMRLLSVKYL
ncbi:2,3-diphosphoglycerate-dependent phosphoglycerate mutase [Chryseobacterium sp. MDT2-18]|uniref:2,3-bisphosphoglycerate-dependent phosphoglycerate mutase n=1 Tax=Chryseobacterium sp. MDT2-18 TaxID=1259136 RepID=UPI002783E2F3|nr:2,3-bisphosphoglycerate-dependent phosphoglycerate mutase [Chryseobacterium sp. MDT2-18]MDQ0478242.1 2,3-bisphosphoglycerate-dependent phosphoglycerate mutase [Chryseobacterium sp. MDT2-18]